MISVVILLKIFKKENESSFLQNEPIVLWNEKDTFWEGYFMTPKRTPRGLWKFNLVSTFLLLSRSLRARIIADFASFKDNNVKIWRDLYLKSIP